MYIVGFYNPLPNKDKRFLHIEVFISAGNKADCQKLKKKKEAFCLVSYAKECTGVNSALADTKHSNNQKLDTAKQQNNNATAGIYLAFFANTTFVRTKLKS